MRRRNFIQGIAASMAWSPVARAQSVPMRINLKTARHLASQFRRTWELPPTR